MSHKKHSKLAKILGGQYGRNEVGIMGAPCGEIKNIVALLIPLLKDKWTISYIDAEHSTKKEDGWSALNYGAKSEYIDKISFKRTDTLQSSPDFNDTDLTLINSNHYLAEAQIAFIHPQKDLSAKLDKLNNVVLIILEDSVEEVPSFLKFFLEDKNIPVVKANALKDIASFVDNWLKARIPTLYGLVLAGGKSTRMQKDKAMLNYHGKPQQEYTIDLLKGICDKVYLSCRDQAQVSATPYDGIADTFIGLGPFGGILSAFMYEPNVAWLVVAIDLPYLDIKTINILADCRNPSKIATTFIDPKNEFPEPLVTIWEPRAYPRMLDFLSRGYSCPRKVLINSDVEIITNRDALAFTNVNTPEEMDEVLKKLHE